eukprot:797470-Ditylum_brightwellii.AAC.1
MHVLQSILICATTGWRHDNGKRCNLLRIYQIEVKHQKFHQGQNCWGGQHHAPDHLDELFCGGTGYELSNNIVYQDN